MTRSAWCVKVRKPLYLDLPVLQSRNPAALKDRQIGNRGMGFAHNAAFCLP
jgi:hypothetical protein